MIDFEIRSGALERPGVPTVQGLVDVGMVVDAKPCQVIGHADGTESRVFLQYKRIPGVPFVICPEDPMVPGCQEGVLAEFCKIPELPEFILGPVLSSVRGITFLDKAMILVQECQVVLVNGKERPAILFPADTAIKCPPQNPVLAGGVACVRSDEVHDPGHVGSIAPPVNGVPGHAPVGGFEDRATVAGNVQPCNESGIRIEEAETGEVEILVIEDGGPLPLSAKRGKHDKENQDEPLERHDLQ